MNLKTSPLIPLQRGKIRLRIKNEINGMLSPFEGGARRAGDVK